MCRETLKELRDVTARLDEQPGVEEKVDLLFFNCRVMKRLFSETLDMLDIHPEHRAKVRQLRRLVNAMPGAEDHDDDQQT